MNYFELHINDWAAATVGLNNAEKGLYLTMMIVYYRDEMPLAERDIERTLGVRSAEDRDALEYLLRTYFELRNGFYHNTRCDEEIAKYHDRSAGAKKAAAARWDRHRSQVAEYAEPMPEPCGSDAPELPAAMPNPCGTDADALRAHYERNAEGYAEPMPEPCGSDALHLATKPTNTSTLSAGARDDPPWWHAEDDPLVVLFATCLASLPPKNAAGQDLRVPETGVRLAVTRARDAAAPLGDEAEVAIRSVMEQFGETYRKTRPGMQAKAWSAILLKWFENKAADWKHGPKPPANQRGSAKVDRRPKYEIDRERAHQALGVAQ